MLPEIGPGQPGPGQLTGPFCHVDHVGLSAAARTAGFNRCCHGSVELAEEGCSVGVRSAQPAGFESLAAGFFPQRNAKWPCSIGA